VQPTNTVDTIYSIWPALLYTNPSIGRYLLEPVLAYQTANPVQGGYAIRDIGEMGCVSRNPNILIGLAGASAYPNVTGPSNRKFLAVQPNLCWILICSHAEVYPVEGVHSLI
jgi:hypothetical protein